MKTKQKPNKTRNWVAVAAWERNGGPMEKRGKGRSRQEPQSRTQVKYRLKTGDYDG